MKYTAQAPTDQNYQLCFYDTLGPRKFNGVGMETTVTYAIWTGLSPTGQRMVNEYRVSQGLESYVLDNTKWAKAKRRPNDTTKKDYFKNS